MVPYTRQPSRLFSCGGVEVASFVSPALNADASTVSSFGDEWSRFATFTEEEIRVAGDEIFDLISADMANAGTVALDLGCGTGRWSRYLAPRVKFIEAIDPSEAVRAAVLLTRASGNVRVTQAGYGDVPFAPATFDLVFSLGVVHHLPDTERAVCEAASMLKPGGWLLLYVYYDLDNRGPLYRATFQVANACRRAISQCPSWMKFAVCDLLAVVVYAPLVLLARLLRRVGWTGWARLPLAYYVGKPWKILRNDALDRFGTPLEKRYRREAIHAMLHRCGLRDIRFSEQQPFWHVVARR